MKSRYVECPAIWVGIVNQFYLKNRSLEIRQRYFQKSRNEMLAFNRKKEELRLKCSILFYAFQ